MRNTNQLGEAVRNRRENLGLTQRLLAQKLHVEASHIAFIENGRRRPSLKLVGRMADVLGFDRQRLLILAHPEAGDLIVQVRQEKKSKTTPSWQRFMKNRELLARYDITDRELDALEHLSLLGTVKTAKEFLAILTLIRDIPSIR